MCLLAARASLLESFLPVFVCLLSICLLVCMCACLLVIHFNIALRKLEAKMLMNQHRTTPSLDTFIIQMSRRRLISQRRSNLNLMLTSVEVTWIAALVRPHRSAAFKMSYWSEHFAIAEKVCPLLINSMCLRRRPFSPSHLFHREWCVQ